MVGYGWGGLGGGGDGGEVVGDSGIAGGEGVGGHGSDVPVKKQ